MFVYVRGNASLVLQLYIIKVIFIYWPTCCYFEVIRYYLGLFVTGLAVLVILIFLFCVS